jgi:hypothetical protein
MEGIFNRGTDLQGYDRKGFELQRAWTQAKQKGDLQPKGTFEPASFPVAVTTKLYNRNILHYLPSSKRKGGRVWGFEVYTRATGHVASRCVSRLLILY